MLKDQSSYNNYNNYIIDEKPPRIKEEKFDKKTGFHIIIYEDETYGHYVAKNATRKSIIEGKAC